MGKGCREDFHLHIALKTGKKPEKKTINNPEKNQIVLGRDSGKVLICTLLSKLAKSLRKKTINNPEKNQIVLGRDSGKVLIYRPWFVFLLFLGFDLMFF